MIGSMRLSDLCGPLEGALHQGDCTFASVSTDTRSLREGDLFVALTGPNFDGNRFVAGAAAAGAAGAIVSSRQEAALAQLEVADTRIALGRLGRLNRRRFEGPLITVTGSSGKTTVKEMIARILAGHGAVLATEGNLNNDIGVPLTLLRLGSAHTHAVIELGASAMGEIAYTVGLVEPDVALITNAAGAHLEGFGSQENIVRGKGEIYDGLAADGTGVVNADDPAAGTWLQRLGSRRVLTFSRADAGADFAALDIRSGPGGMHAFRLRTPAGETDIELAVPGAHNVSNALAAAAAAHAVGTDLPSIRDGLAAFDGVQGRLCHMTTTGGAVLIDDSYNANPASFRAAIDVLAAQAGRKVLVMGDMAELGPEAAAAHAATGEYARARGIDRLHATGTLSRAACDAFGGQGHWSENRNELVQALRALDEENTCFLVKGSRSAGMDAVVRALTGAEDS